KCLLYQVGCRTHQARVGAADDMDGNGCQVVPESPFVAETCMEGRAGKVVAQLWNDPPAQKNAAACAECQCQVGCCRPQNGAEDVQRAHAVGARPLEGTLTDLGRCQRFQLQAGLSCQASMYEL